MRKSPKVDVQKHDAAMRTESAVSAGLKWHSPNAAPFYLAGLPWFARNGLYRRMPNDPARPLPPGVEDTCQAPAGAQVRFRTDSAHLALKVRLSAPAGMYHMPATGECGFDCYIGAGDSAPRYFKTARWEPKSAEYECELFALAGRAMRYVIVNFPLYGGVEKVLLGLDAGARIEPPPTYALPGPVVFYGTSITQGGCASRPGMAFTNIISRRLNVEVINLGFSGSGRGEPVVAEIIAEIPRPSLYVLDYEANCPSVDHLRQTLPEFIRILRAAHPRAPVLVVSRPRFSAELFLPAKFQDRLARRDCLRQCVQTLRAAGDDHIFFLDGSDFLGGDFEECTVDGIHPTDLGFMRIADAMTPVVRALLGL